MFSSFLEGSGIDQPMAGDGPWRLGKRDIFFKNLEKPLEWSTFLDLVRSGPL